MFVSSGATGDPTLASVNTLNVYLTSAAVTGFPSCHRARGSRANAIDNESGAHVQLLAKRGENPLSPMVDMSGPISAKRSKTRSWTMRPFRSFTNGGNRSTGSPEGDMMNVPPVVASVALDVSFELQAARTAADKINATEMRIVADGSGWDS